MKKYYAILLCVLLVASTNLFAQTTFVEDGIKYEVTSASPATVQVIANTPKYSGVVAIPPSVTNAGTIYSVTAIGREAFDQCSGLTSVTIPNSVTTIGEMAFYDCRGLTSVDIPNSVITLNRWAFAGCTSLKTVTIPNSVKTIGNNAFLGCSGLTSVTIGNSVTTIGEWAFYDCRGLTSVTIGYSVIGIGQGAFSLCTGLAHIYSLNPTPANLYSTVFYEVKTDSCTLHVPADSTAAYQALAQWNEFRNIVGDAGSGITHTATPIVVLYPNPATEAFGIQGLEQKTRVQVYTLAGTQVFEKTIAPNELVNIATWSKGAYLVKAGGKTSKLVVK